MAENEAIKAEQATDTGSAGATERPLLDVRNLKTSFFTHVGEVKAIRDVSFTVGQGEIVGIVGESGSGKSVTSLSIMGLLQDPGKVVGGQILFDGQDLLKKRPSEMRRVRGAQIAMVFQDPMTALDPLFTVGDQIVETVREHQKVSKEQARQRAVEMLSLVGIPSPEERMGQYPHEFSGGMRQRAMIAMALSCRPRLLIADEPTTALDVTVQAQVLELLKSLNAEMGMSTILITHDLACVASTCSKVLVMYGGQLMETGSDKDVFYRPRHPYTMGLLNSVPRRSVEAGRRRLVPIQGTPPDLLNPPTGCPFYPRCPFAMKICAQQEVPYFEVGEGHSAKCWLCHPDAPKVEAYEAQKGGIAHDAE